MIDRKQVKRLVFFCGGVQEAANVLRQHFGMPRRVYSGDRHAKQDIEATIERFPGGSIAGVVEFMDKRLLTERKSPKAKRGKTRAETNWLMGRGVRQ